jgi:hypothetical protein
MHDALRRLLDPVLVRHLADLAEPTPFGPENLKTLDRVRREFQQNAWRRCREFLREAQSIYRTLAERAQLPAANFALPASLEEAFQERLRRVMLLPTLEALFPRGWPTAARRILPSHSPRLAITALWGPAFAWCVLELLAESIDTLQPQHAALDLFDRLRLREPLSELFASLGVEGDDSWRAAARIKATLLVEAGVLAPPPPAPVAAEPHPSDATRLAATLPAPSLPATDWLVPRPLSPPSESAPPIHSPAFWQDADLRWLSGAHESGGYTYLIQEPFEELLWWLQLPALCRLAAEDQPLPSTVLRIVRNVEDSAASANRAHYRVDQLTSEG